jgi:hypothetical protein
MSEMVAIGNENFQKLLKSVAMEELKSILLRLRDFPVDTHENILRGMGILFNRRVRDLREMFAKL